MSLQEDKAKLFQSPTYRGPTKDVDVDGITLEIRAPRVRHTVKNLGGNGKVEFSQTADMEELLLDCVYHKASGQPFFEREDLEALAQASGHEGGLLNKIYTAITELGAEQDAESTDDRVKN